MTSDVKDLYVTALRNTHAMELQALQIMERQVERLENYPEMAQALRRHIEETHVQRDRLESALGALGEGPSHVKEGVLGLVGNLMALGHTPASDEVVKNALANQAFENYEIAAYRALLTIGQKMPGTDGHLSAFQDSLREEENMARLAADLVGPTTARYVELSLAGHKADR